MFKNIALQYNFQKIIIDKSPLLNDKLKTYLKGNGGVNGI
jgi:hypothetical protein